MGARIVRRGRRRNPGDELPYDQWIPAEAVRFHTNGTVDVETRSPVPNVSDGYRDSRGIFHPIRWAMDYDPERAGEEDDYNVRPSAAYYRKHGLKAPKSAGSGRRRKAKAKKRAAKKSSGRKRARSRRR